MVKPKQSSGARKLMGCIYCSFNKRKTSHTYATYKVYIRSKDIVLKCKKCGFEQVVDGLPVRDIVMNKKGDNFGVY